MNFTNQFFYTRKEQLPTEEGKEPQFKECIDSFNLNKVIRSVEDENTLVILMDDIHQRIESVPVYSNKGKVTGQKNQTVTYQSTIILEGEDIKRFREACGYIQK